MPLERKCISRCTWSFPWWLTCARPAPARPLLLPQASKAAGAAESSTEDRGLSSSVTVYGTLMAKDGIITLVRVAGCGAPCGRWWR